jgi:hypothetical protein
LDEKMVGNRGDSEKKITRGEMRVEGERVGQGEGGEGEGKEEREHEGEGGRGSTRRTKDGRKGKRGEEEKEEPCCMASDCLVLPTFATWSCLRCRLMG